MDFLAAEAEGTWDPLGLLGSDVDENVEGALVAAEDALGALASLGQLVMALSLVERLRIVSMLSKLPVASVC